MSDRPLFAILGHHKCATIWLEDIARVVCQRLGLKLAVVYNEDQFGRDLPKFVRDQDVDFLVYGNADIQYTRPVKNLRGIHIVRDPRDIVVSAYFSHLYSHSTTRWKELIKHRELLQTLDKDEGLTEEIRFRSRSFGHLATWDYDQEHVLEIRFEDIATNSYETMLKAYSFLGLLTDDVTYNRRARLAYLARDVLNRSHHRSHGLMPLRSYPDCLPPPELLTIIWNHRYSARANGRDKGSEDIRSHYRSGRSGDWVTHFHEGHKSMFKSLYPGLVPNLGYAKTDDW